MLNWGHRLVENLHSLQKTPPKTKKLAGTVPEVGPRGVLGAMYRVQSGCYAKLLSNNE